MPWITVDCLLPDHEKMAELPSDSARWGWIVVLTRAKLQRQPGRFASERHFREVMGRHGRFLPAFRAVRLIDSDGDAVVVHDWDRHQWKVNKERQREDNAETHEGQEKDSRARNVVPVPVYVEETGVEGFGEAGARPEVFQLQRLAEELTGRAYAMANVHGGFGAQALEHLDAHGYVAVAQAWRDVAAEVKGKPTMRQLVFGADAVLNPVPKMGQKVAERDRAAREEAERADFDRRVAATKARIADMQRAV